MKISRGKIELRISSLNHGKIIEKFKKEGITLYNCKREYKRLSCRISLEEKNRVITILEKNNLDFSFGKTYGLLSVVQCFFSRIGLWVGILLLVTICVLYSTTYFTSPVTSSPSHSGFTKASSSEESSTSATVRPSLSP